MSNMRWLPTSEKDPFTRWENKIYQAEMLANCLYGIPGEGFRKANDVIQDGVLFLLAELITEAREAHNEWAAEKKCKASKVSA
jgi:hypothetical protein